MLKYLKLSIIGLVFLPFACMADEPYYGINFSYGITARSCPHHLRSVQLMLSYDPQQFKWGHFNTYFDIGFSHFWDNSLGYNTNINIYSIAPVIRYTFSKLNWFRPYLEFSIGFSYLDHTHIEKRNLGIHFAFQDRLGIGMHLGQKEQLSIGVHAVHYSNAHFSSHNSGISMPVTLDIGYRFH